MSSFSFFFFFSFLVRGPAAGQTGPGRGGRGSGAEGGGEGRVSLENGGMEPNIGVASFQGDCGGPLLGPATFIEEPLSKQLRSLGPLCTRDSEVKEELQGAPHIPVQESYQT